MNIVTSLERFKLGEPVYENGWVILNEHNSIWVCQLFKTPEDAHRCIQAEWPDYEDQWSKLKVVKGKATFEPIIHTTLSTVSVAREVIKDVGEAQS